eukprot:Phypoly_transcript_03810.p1 GENE.Phypoly_transcript_03810~~Phypoly_transcript_03810.p1  ORF type:complete len:581 (+),score=100.19 Phypoly_transcript_03810:559-2301(+)
MALHEIIRLHTSHEHFVFEAKTPQEGDKLVINRSTGNFVSHEEVKGAPYNPASTVDDIYGILGIIKLLTGPYLIVITGRRLVGRINGADIWTITTTKLISFQRESETIGNNNWQYQDELKYRKMIETVLAIKGFYFSYSYDLTHSQQRINQMSTELKHEPLWARIDHRFWWNRALLQDLIKAKLNAWVLPVMMGFVEIHTSEINGIPFDFVLIARRNARRVGTRYYVRGVDKEGNVANSVETEQIIFHDGVATSLVQTRGSIPLFWRQTPSLKYKPRLEIYGAEIETPPAFRRHLEDLNKQYNRVVAINLIDQKGSELLLGNAFEREAKKHPELKYIAFDFHNQCRNMRYDKLSILMDQIADDVDKNGYFYAENGKVLKQQQGVFRTNCIDNLDRTNVVQSLIARKSLSDQLVNHKIFTNRNDKIENYPAFERVFKDVWANHADTVSFQYSGTGALKTDFTRTGKRTIQGAFNDGVNSITRYYLNNFTDGFRQDAFDLFLGNYVPVPTDRTPFKKPVLDLVKVVTVAMGIFVLGLILPHEHKLFFSVSFCLIAIAGARIATMFGKQFVNKPSLYLKEHEN